MKSGLTAVTAPKRKGEPKATDGLDLRGAAIGK